MANKQYTSIIRLFDHCNIPIGDDLNLSRVKKQLLAEFGIAKDGFIEVDGYNYTRHDVMEEIDLPDFPKRLEFHKQIWRSSQILQLLEKSTVNLNTIRSEFTPFWSNKEFDAFFSPYFAGPFNYISRTLLAEGKLSKTGDLLLYEDFLQPAEREEAFRPIRLFLDENMRLLRNVTKENYNVIRPKIIHWIDRDWHNFFNNLPAEFYETKNEIITKIINIGVAIQKTNRHDCKRMSEQLMALQETPESLRSIIVSNHAVYMGQSSKSGSWGNMFWIGWVIFMIIRMVASDGCGDSKKDSYKYLPPDYFKKSEINIDSLIKNMQPPKIEIVPESSVIKTIPRLPN